MFRRQQRLRRQADFEFTRARGRRVGDRLLLLMTARSGLPRSRFGLAVGKRVGNAVVRNRVKRRLRASLRALPFRCGLNVVVAARPQAAQADYRMLRASLEELACRVRALKQ